MRLRSRTTHPNKSHPGIGLLWASGLFLFSLTDAHVCGLVLSIVANIVYAVCYRNVPLKELFAYIRVPIVFAFFAAASLPLEVSWGTQGPELHLSAKEGTIAASFIFVRSTSAIFTLATLFLTERIEEILSTCARFGVPSAIVELMLLVYNSIHDLAFSAAKMQRSADARLGFSGVHNQIRTAGMIASGLWLQALSLTRAKQVGLSTRSLESFSFASSVTLPKFRSAEVVATLAAVASIWIASHFLEGVFL